MTWDDAASHCQQSLHHLENMNHDILVSWRESDDEVMHNYAKEFDLSRAETDKVCFK